MKNLVSNGSARVVLLAPLLLIASAGCTRRAAPIPEVPVNPAFETSPPIATDIQIKQTKSSNGNLLVVADFGRGVINGRFHAVSAGSEKVVLRDDGEGGDEVADDGRFSVMLAEDLPALTRDLETAQQNEGKTQASPRPVFRGRELITSSREPLRRLDLDGFRKRGPIHLDPKMFCPVLLDFSVEHSLMVTDVSVVEDPTRTNVTPCTSPSAVKAWTFGKLMTDMANTPMTGISGENFVKDWLNSWLNTIVVNADQVVERDRLFDLVIRPWVVNSGSPAGSFDSSNWTSHTLDLAKAPFKLTAIVNRLDLRGNSGYGFANPGEGRFIFEVLDPNGCSPLSPAFTVILEYGIPIRDCAGLRAYGQKWYDLKSLALGTPAYNTALQEITDVFARANAAPGKPNGSAINQIRTNEILLDFSAWELREFNVDQTGHLLFLTTVKQEPAEKYNARGGAPGSAAEIALMADWVNTNASAIGADMHSVPLALPTGEPFRGGKAHTAGARFWDAAPLAIMNDEARHHFSLNTCSGCHGAETNTPFVHVGLAPFGSPASLSGFLTGVSVVDPAGRPAALPKTRMFGDLERRRGDLETLLCMTCRSRLFDLVGALTFKPIHMTH